MKKVEFVTSGCEVSRNKSSQLDKGNNLGKADKLCFLSEIKIKGCHEGCHGG